MKQRNKAKKLLLRQKEFENLSMQERKGRDKPGSFKK